MLIFLLAAMMFGMALLNGLDHLFNGAMLDMLWYCNWAGFLLSYALLRKNRILLSSLLTTSIAFQTPWLLDFFLYKFGVSAGRTSHMTVGMSGYTFALATILHTIVVPVSYYGVWRTAFSPGAIYLSLLGTAAVLAGSFLFTPLPLNVNCAFFPCDLSYSSNRVLLAKHPIYATNGYLLLNITVSMLGVFVVDRMLRLHFTRRERRLSNFPEP